MNGSKIWMGLVVVLLMFGLFGWANATWTPPTDLPPTCDSANAACNPPLNVSSIDQAKMGSLTIGSASAPLFTLDVPSGSGFFGSGLAVVGDVLFSNGLGIALPVGQLPTTGLDVNGQVRIRGGGPTDGYVLTTDSNGLATWQSAAPGSPGSSVMYLKVTSISLPPSCPAPFTQLGSNAVSSSAATSNIVTTCYTTSSICQVLELQSSLSETPPACPAGFSQALYGTFYLADATNRIRTCFACQSLGNNLGSSL